MDGNKRPGEGKSGPARKRTAIDLGLKIKIIRKYEGGQSLSAIARELGLAVSTVNSIVKDAARIKQHVKGTACLKSTIITKRREGAISEMENVLTLWMEDQLQKRVPLSLMTIQAKARGLFDELKKKYPEGTQSFTASSGWFARFKNRAGFHNVKVNGESTSGGAEQARKFPRWLQRMIDGGPYLPEQIFNADETALFWKKMPSRTYISKQEKTMPGYQASKDRLTLLFGGNASGSYKLKPLLVYHSENPRALKGISKATLPVHYRSNSKGWLTLEIFEDWFVNCFIPEAERHCKENGIPFKILLILDSAPGHPAHLDDFHPDVKVVYFPRNGASSLQPMVQGVIANFKAYYLRTTFAQAVVALDENPHLTLNDFWESYDLYHAIRNIAKAWAEISQMCMNSVWKKLCPQFVPDFRGFEKGRVFEEVSKKILQLGKQLHVEVNEEDVEELIGSHDEELSDADLMMLEAARVAEDERGEAAEPEVEPKQFTEKEMATAFKELNSCLARFEKMDPNTSRFLKVQRMAEDAFACYREIYEEKKKAVLPISLDRFVHKAERLGTSQASESQVQASSSHDVTHTASRDVGGPAAREAGIDHDLQPITT